VSTSDSVSASAAVLERIAFPETLSPDVIARTVAPECGVQMGQALRTLELLDGGNTVPFVARYRKEATGNLDEVQIQAVQDRAAALRALHERKHDVLRLIASQEKLTDELARMIVDAPTLQAVEDLYLPYRPKRKTRASVARERGLQPLAESILQQRRIAGDPADAREQAASAFISTERGVETAEGALAGARDICAETVMEDALVRRCGEGGRERPERSLPVVL
jgi:uncharacterized protein